MCSIAFEYSLKVLFARKALCLHRCHHRIATLYCSALHQKMTIPLSYIKIITIRTRLLYRRYYHFTAPSLDGWFSPIYQLSLPNLILPCWTYFFVISLANYTSRMLSLFYFFNIFFSVFYQLDKRYFVIKLVLVGRNGRTIYFYSVGRTVGLSFVIFREGTGI